MAFEIKPWKEPDCDLGVEIAKISDREIASAEINKEYGEGGGLNANYQTVEAVLKVGNVLGLSGLKEGEHFVWKTAGLDKISFDFCDKATKDKAEKILQEAFSL